MYGPSTSRGQAQSDITKPHLPFELAASLAASDPESGLVLKEKQESTVFLAWPALKDLGAAVARVLDKRMCFYDNNLGGAPVAWHRARINPMSAQTTGDNRDMVLRLCADYVVFAPMKDAVLKAVVTHVQTREGSDGPQCVINCLAHGLFNVIITEKPTKHLKEGKTVRVKVEFVSKAKGIVRVHGVVVKPREKIHHMPDILADLDSMALEPDEMEIKSKNLDEEIALVGRDLDAPENEHELTKNQKKKEKRKKKKRKHAELEEALLGLDPALNLDAESTPKKRKIEVLEQEKREIIDEVKEETVEVEEEIVETEHKKKKKKKSISEDFDNDGGEKKKKKRKHSLD